MSGRHAQAGASQSAPRDATHRGGPGGWLYHRALAAVENGLLIVLLAGTIGISFIEILNRNFNWQLWDSAAASKIVYALTFYLGLFGAVVATRHFKHIRIDAVSPYLNVAGRTTLEWFASAIGLVGTAWAAYTSWRFVAEFISPDDRFLPDKSAVYWQLRWWRYPICIAFAWMAAHFAVHFVSLGRAILRREYPEHLHALASATSDQEAEP